MDIPGLLISSMPGLPCPGSRDQHHPGCRRANLFPVTMAMRSIREFAKNSYRQIAFGYDKGIAMDENRTNLTHGIELLVS
jgi:hypothetical protein